MSYNVFLQEDVPFGGCTDTAPHLVSENAAKLLQWFQSNFAQYGSWVVPKCAHKS